MVFAIFDKLPPIDVNNDADALSNSMGFDKEDIFEKFGDKQIRQMQQNRGETNQLNEDETDLEQLDNILDCGLLDY